jgi:hypothetical protein
MGNNCQKQQSELEIIPLEAPPSYDYYNFDEFITNVPICMITPDIGNRLTAVHEGKFRGHDIRIHICVNNIYVCYMVCIDGSYKNMNRPWICNDDCFKHLKITTECPDSSICTKQSPACTWHHNDDLLIHSICRECAVQATIESLEDPIINMITTIDLEIQQIKDKEKLKEELLLKEHIRLMKIQKEQKEQLLKKQIIRTKELLIEQKRKEEKKLVSKNLEEEAALRRLQK